MSNTILRRIFVLSNCTAALVWGALSTGSCFAASPPGLAYAHVLGNGTLDAANSRNVVAIAGDNGLYCFKLTFRPKNAVATLSDDPTAPNQGVGFIKVALPPSPTFTCSTMQKPDAVVETGDEKSINGGKSAGGYAFYVQWTR